jgi:hypothetical protein
MARRPIHLRWIYVRDHAPLFAALAVALVVGLIGAIVLVSDPARGLLAGILPTGFGIVVWGLTNRAGYPDRTPETLAHERSGFGADGSTEDRERWDPFEGQRRAIASGDPFATEASNESENPADGPPPRKPVSKPAANAKRSDGSEVPSKRPAPETARTEPSMKTPPARQPTDPIASRPPALSSDKEGQSRKARRHEERAAQEAPATPQPAPPKTQSPGPGAQSSKPDPPTAPPNPPERSTPVPEQREGLAQSEGLPPPSKEAPSAQTASSTGNDAAPGKAKKRQSRKIARRDQRATPLGQTAEGPTPPATNQPPPATDNRRRARTTEDRDRSILVPAASSDPAKPPSERAREAVANKRPANQADPSPNEKKQVSPPDGQELLSPAEAAMRDAAARKRFTKNRGEKPDAAV